MTPDTVQILQDLGDADRAAQMARYHKVDRTYLGISNPVLNDLTKEWRRTLDLPARCAEARRLWAANAHESRIAAAKLLTQARIRPDDEVWEIILEWLPEFDAWAIADHACSAGSRRLVADPDRLDTVETWTTAPSMWVRRAALVMTLPFVKSNNPTRQEEEIRDRVLGWAAGYVTDPEWFIQKAVAWWVRDLSKHDPARASSFLQEHGPTMKPFARREAAKYLGPKS